MSSGAATTCSHLVCLFCVTAGQNGENLGSDEEQIVLFVYLLYDVTNNKVRHSWNANMTSAVQQCSMYELAMNCIQRYFLLLSCFSSYYDHKLFLFCLTSTYGAQRQQQRQLGLLMQLHHSVNVCYVYSISFHYVRVNRATLDVLSVAETHSSLNPTIQRLLECLRFCLSLSLVSSSQCHELTHTY